MNISKNKSASKREPQTATDPILSNYAKLDCGATQAALGLQPDNSLSPLERDFMQTASYVEMFGEFISRRTIGRFDDFTYSLQSQIEGALNRLSR